MSKCDLEIVFDRADRTYRSGEEVSGTVNVSVNQDLQCNGLLVEHFWQTHGRGNTATGTKQERILDKGDWRAGDTFSHRFSFTAPGGPPTYRGHFLNIDHYVNVRVDIPWARDPKLKEEYILLSGGPYGNLPAAGGQGQQAAQVFSRLGVPIGVIMIMGGIIFACPFGVVLIPGGCIVLFFALRKVLAQKKLGSIKLHWGSLRVAPGGTAALRLEFTPRKSTSLNGITAKLVGAERCVSGSGTNKTTHTHKLHEQTVVLMPASDLSAGQPIRLDGTVPIPQTEAFSFSAPENELIWSLEVRIDIPLWPDWKEKRVLTVRPAAEGEAGEVVEASVVRQPPPDEVALFPPVVEAEPVEREQTPWEEPAPTEPAWRDEHDETPPAVEEPPEVAPVSCDPALVALVGQLMAASRYGPEREDIIEASAGQSFDCVVETERVDRTLSYGVDERFRDGRTLVGVIPGTDCKVGLQMSEARNDQLDSLQRGGTLQVTCTLVKWNNIYDRLDMQEA